ncbi:uncharacterized protein [Drosophila takahashii]|uniref:uncharacterized protein n=1 Tax=Drosophila takahashii TaxID=29030 RepID=UPI0038996AF8
MHHLIQEPQLKEIHVETADITGKLACASTVKLNANAQEFVPLYKRAESTKDEAMVDRNDMKKTVEDEQKLKSNLTLPWKGFPKKSEKSARSAQVVLLNDVDYMILPCIKRAKKPKEEKLLVDLPPHTGPKEMAPTTSSNVIPSTSSLAEKPFDVEEKRREHERNVALEALKLSEQRRLRGPLIPPIQGVENSDKVQPVIHLSRSPIRFTPDERVKVDRLRAAKRERIERILREMINEKQEQLKLEQSQQQKKSRYDENEQKPSIAIEQEPVKKVEVAEVVPKKRYIPTTKEWDEQCRAKYFAKMGAEKKNQGLTSLPSHIQTPTKPPLVNSNVVNITASGIIRLGDLRATTKPRYCPPAELLAAEKRRGNLTHFRPLANWNIRRNPLAPLKESINQKGHIVQRYSIEKLLELEPQPEELENPSLDEALCNLGFLCD